MESCYYMIWYYKALNKMSRIGFMNSVLEEFFFFFYHKTYLVFLSAVSQMSKAVRALSFLNLLVCEDVKYKSRYVICMIKFNKAVLLTYVHLSASICTKHHAT